MNNTTNTNIFGCYVSVTHPYPEVSQEAKDLSLLEGRLFRTYVWSEKGICDKLKKLKHENYGIDLKLILFQFYVNPLPIEAKNLNEIEVYKKKEKSIAIPIIVNDENFFSKSNEERLSFFKQSFLRKLDLLAEVVKQKKLDTNIDLLKSDLIREL